MPKSKSNARPYNKTEKREVAKTKSVRQKMIKEGIHESYVYGATAMEGSAGKASQARREGARQVEILKAAKMKKKR